MSANERSSEVRPRHHRRWSSCRSAKCRVDAEVVVRVHDKHHEVYAGEVLDSRTTLVHRGTRPDLLDPEIVRVAAEQNLLLVERPSRTVLRVQASTHSDVFRAVSAPPASVSRWSVRLRGAHRVAGAGDRWWRGGHAPTVPRPGLGPVRRHRAGR